MVGKFQEDRAGEQREEQATQQVNKIGLLVLRHVSGWLPSPRRESPRIVIRSAQSVNAAAFTAACGRVRANGSTRGAVVFVSIQDFNPAAVTRARVFPGDGLAVGAVFERSVQRLRQLSFLIVVQVRDRTLAQEADILCSR
jgi:hypothetical protein